MPGKAFRITAMIASAGLGLYSLYKIFSALIYIFDPLRSAGMTILEKLNFLFIPSAYYGELFMLSICGFWLVYRDFSAAKGAAISRRALVVKQIIVSFFILFSILSIIDNGLILIYSFQSYQAIMQHGANQGIMILSFLFGMISFPLMIAVDSSGILFGIYMLSQKDILRKIAVAVCITVSAISGIQLIIAFVNRALFYIRTTNAFALYGITMDQVYQSIFDFLRSMFILAASLIIIIYGTRKNKIIIKEKIENTNECTTDRTYEK